MHLLVDPRYGAEAVRVDFHEVARELVDRLRVGDRGEAVEVGVIEHPLEDVREWQERERHRVGGERNHLATRHGVEHQVRVGQHRPLGLPRRTRGVDDRRDVFGLDAVGPLVEDGRAHLERRTPAVHDRVKRRVARLPRRIALDQDHVVEARALPLDGQDLAELLECGDEQGPGAGVVQQRRDLARRERRIDRNGPGSCAQDGVVGHGPLGPVLGEDRDAVSRLDAEAVQAQRKRPNGESEVRGRNRLPLSVDLGDQQVRFPAGRRRPEEIAEGAGCARHRISLLAGLCPAPRSRSRTATPAMPAPRTDDAGRVGLADSK
jgi:hypothetical protein